MNKNSDMEKLESLGARLRWARKRAKLTQAAAVKAIGLTQPTLSDLENDKTQSTASILEFAALYDVSATWLRTGRGAAVVDAASAENVNSPITEEKGALSIESAREERARLLAETLLDVSSEMRALIERLIQADYEGGAVREMTIAGVGYVLRSIPVEHTQKKVK